MPVERVPGFWDYLSGGFDRGLQIAEQRRQEKERKEEMERRRKQEEIMQTWNLLGAGQIDAETAADRLKSLGWTGAVRIPKHEQVDRELARAGGIGGMDENTAVRLGLGKEWGQSRERMTAEAAIPTTVAARKAYLKRTYPDLSPEELEVAATDSSAFEAFEDRARNMRPQWDQRSQQWVDPITGQATTPAGLRAPVVTPRADGGGGRGSAAAGDPFKTPQGRALEWEVDTQKRNLAVINAEIAKQGTKAPTRDQLARQQMAQAQLANAENRMRQLLFPPNPAFAGVQGGARGLEGGPAAAPPPPTAQRMPGVVGGSSSVAAAPPPAAPAMRLTPEQQDKLRQAQVDLQALIGTPNEATAREIYSEVVAGITGGAQQPAPAAPPAAAPAPQVMRGPAAAAAARPPVAPPPLPRPVAPTPVPPPAARQPMVPPRPAAAPPQAAAPAPPANRFQVMVSDPRFEPITKRDHELAARYRRMKPAKRREFLQLALQRRPAEGQRLAELLEAQGISLND